MSRYLIKTIFVGLTLALTSSPMLYAQENGGHYPEPERSSEEEYNSSEEWNVKEGGMMLPEKNDTPPSESGDAVTSGSEKTRFKAPAKKAESKPPVSDVSNTKSFKQEEDESVLSFNFLYYLIQKFKFDTVE